MTDVPKNIEELVEKYTTFHFLDVVSRIFLIIAGISEKNLNSISSFKIKKFIQTFFHFTDKEIDDSWKKIKDLGLVSYYSANKWNRLSKNGYWIWDKLVLNLKKEKIFDITQEFVLKFLKNFDSPKTNIDWKKIRKLTKHRGYDLLIYVDEGEKDKLDRILEFFNDKFYRKIYILCSDTKDSQFPKKMQEKLSKNSLTKPIIFQIDIEGSKNPLVECEFLTEPRRVMDIIFTAMPRKIVICLYIKLNLARSSCSQNWYYNKALKYTYHKGDVLYTEYVKGAEVENSSIFFGEITSKRLTNLEFFSEISSANVMYQIFPKPKEFSTIDERIGARVYQAMNQIRASNIVKLYMDYNSVFDVFQKLIYYHPNKIFVGGNRIVALGIAKYYCYCFQEEFLNNQGVFKRPSLVFTHIKADKYSIGGAPNYITALQM